MSLQEFVYEAVSQDGSLAQGTISGENDRDVVLRLTRRGLTPIRVAPAGAGRATAPAAKAKPAPTKGVADKTSGQRRFSLRLARLMPSVGRNKDLIRFAETLSVLLEAGVSLDRALAISSELAANRRFGNLLRDLRERVREGSSLADALETQGRLFPPVFIGMVRAGERGGILEAVLKRLTEYLSGVQELRDYMISAMIYPAILALTSVGSMAVLLTLVIPRFAIIFEDLGVTLPLTTRILLAGGHFFEVWWWAVLLGCILFAFTLRQAVRTPAGRRIWDTFKLKFPLVGPIVVKMEVARLASTIGTLLGNGVAILSALQMGRQVVQNTILSQALVRVHQDLKEGEAFSTSLGRVPYFPRQAIHMVAVGEETGRLEPMLNKVAGLYDRELKVAVKAFTSLVEPMIILIMGLMIGTIVVSMLLAIFSVNQMEF